MVICRKQELDAYRDVLKANRELPSTWLEVLERIPASAHPMDVMRTGSPCWAI